VVRSSIYLYTSIAVCLLATACSTKSCPAVAVPGLKISVADVSGKPVCDATVTADDKDFSAVLQPMGAGPSCYYTGVVERAGTYTVTATSGKQMGLASKVRVVKGECGVKTVTATIRMGFPDT
jgi:hypothetical protein